IALARPMRCAIHKQSNAIGGGFAGECDRMKSSKGSRIREEVAHPLETASLRIEHGKGGRRGRPKIKIEPALIIIATGSLNASNAGKLPIFERGAATTKIVVFVNVR